jgi:asparagine synthase (glutamine-hydrolysing)
MCGIVGVLDRAGRPVSRQALVHATDLIEHRGPDDSGHFFLDPADGAWALDPAADSPVPVRGALAFGHRRLSILDLSPAGHQPMGDAAGEIWITYNGEIYNFKELRAELESRGYRFKSQTDTEVILYGYREWGIQVVERLNGIFAFGLWDQRSRRLYLVRDRLGIKPLYYTLAGDLLFFGSEIKSLFVFDEVVPALDAGALQQYLTFLWVPDPDTLFAGIYKVPGGHYLVVEADRTDLVRYWAPRFHEEPIAEREAIDLVRDRLARAVNAQMVSDVPLGAFLSGGVDSSAILALMRSDHPISTFTVGFTPRDLKYDIVPDDVRFARIVGKAFNTDYNEIMLDPQVVDLLPKVVWHMDEPVADPAAISSYLICQEARRKLTVMLSGQGGDEVFAGYPRHLAMKVAEAYLRLPEAARKGFFRPLVGKLPGSGGFPFSATFRNAKKLLRSAELPFRERYLGFGTYFSGDERRALLTGDYRDAGADPLRQHLAYFDEVRDQDPINQLLYIDMMTFLPCLNLTYSDKMSMAHSIEVRVPFLDNELVDAAGRLPANLKMKGLTRKYVLKKAVESVLPHEVVWRKKAGFAAPIRSWLRNDLREMTGDLLSEDSVRRRGLFEHGEVRRVLDAFYQGREDNSLKIWQLLTLEIWQRTFIDAKERVAG